MPTGQRTDPARNFAFMVEIDGIVGATFSECTGFGSTTEIIEQREGGKNETVYKLPGKTSYSNITLKGGVIHSGVLWDWRQAAISGQKTMRRNGSIILWSLDYGSEIARWNFEGAWPTQWEGPALNAKGAEVAIETLVLAIDRLERA